jgi:hypothetical protein
MYDVIYAIVACGAMLAAVLIAAFAYIINEKWTEFVNRQNDLLDKMNREWSEAYMKMVNMKAEAAENERD